MYPTGGFLLSRANRVTPMQSSDSDLSPSCIPIITDDRLVKYTNDCRCFSLGINVIQRYRKSVLRNKEFRFKSNIIPKYPMSKSISRNLVELQHLDLDLRLLSLLKIFVEVAHRFVNSGG